MVLEEWQRSDFTYLRQTYRDYPHGNEDLLDSAVARVLFNPAPTAPSFSPLFIVRLFSTLEPRLPFSPFEPRTLPFITFLRSSSAILFTIQLSVNCSRKESLFCLVQRSSSVSKPTSLHRITPPNIYACFLRVCLLPLRRKGLVMEKLCSYGTFTFQGVSSFQSDEAEFR